MVRVKLIELTAVRKPGRPRSVRLPLKWTHCLNFRDGIIHLNEGSFYAHWQTYRSTN